MSDLKVQEIVCESCEEAIVDGACEDCGENQIKKKKIPGIPEPYDKIIHVDPESGEAYPVNGSTVVEMPFTCSGEGCKPQSMMGIRVNRGVGEQFCTECQTLRPWSCFAVIGDSFYGCSKRKQTKSVTTGVPDKYQFNVGWSDDGLIYGCQNPECFQQKQTRIHTARMVKQHTNFIAKALDSKSSDKPKIVDETGALAKKFSAETGAMSSFAQGFVRNYDLTTVRSQKKLVLKDLDHNDDVEQVNDQFASFIGKDMIDNFKRFRDQQKASRARALDPRLNNIHIQGVDDDDDF